MKRMLFMLLTVLIASSSLYAGGVQEKPVSQEPEVVTVYAYDSFVSEWGPGPVIAEGFTKATGIEVNLVAAGDSGQVLQRAILEKAAPKADVLVGVDNNLLYKALSENVFSAYGSPELGNIDGELLFDGTNHVLPFDYGFFSIIYNTEVISDPPTSLEDLTDPKYEDKLIIMDPRTSSPGLGFLLWTIAEYGDDTAAYWERLKPSLLTVTDGWDTGYGLFTSGEAPMVLSYTTSPAYHVEYEETERYQAAIFPAGHYLQIEGVSLVNGAPNEDGAKQFIDYMLSAEAQDMIPLTNWMYPTHSGITLPASYDFAPMPPSMLTLESGQITAELDSWLEDWTKLMSR